ncbi:16S rRNA (guanine(966)-N(2))-methyltransferase RsmD [Breoghania sp.]|uniref:16S rRNA (guanine(966)-N(2))-methyltransferase RsmD n=1 Tax=Breoghania sp. TaxID=2065378 RepID=UPI0026038ECB|nr:16S rRNA (guanine(966)-N(2))-methyltransferase RsmD [Breoghania sp.]MDJ0930242.1 16S rRNA (guanine(966)-N(2))-methyltransferase RsmD [Breoghania sp.]
MRIISGRFRGTHLATPKSAATRPSSDRLRETVFNILAHGFDDAAEDARVLDLFAGTGALGLEALSHGARSCVFVEEAVEPRGLIRRNSETMGLTGATKIFRRDATRLGDAGTIEPFDLVFLDPPYRKGLGEKALSSALAGGWLKPTALCVLEEAADSIVEVPARFETVEERGIGDSKVLFLRLSGK